MLAPENDVQDFILHPRNKVKPDRIANEPLIKPYHFGKYKQSKGDIIMEELSAALQSLDYKWSALTIITAFLLAGEISLPKLGTYKGLAAIIIGEIHGGRSSGKAYAVFRAEKRLYKDQTDKACDSMSYVFRTIEQGFYSKFEEGLERLSSSYIHTDNEHLQSYLSGKQHAINNKDLCKLSEYMSVHNSLLLSQDEILKLIDADIKMINEDADEEEYARLEKRQDTDRADIKSERETIKRMNELDENFREWKEGNLKKLEVELYRRINYHYTADNIISRQDFFALLEKPKKGGQAPLIKLYERSADEIYNTARRLKLDFVKKHLI